MRLSLPLRRRRFGVAIALSIALSVAPAHAAAQPPDAGAAGAAFDVQVVKTGLYLISGGGANTLLRFSGNGLILVDAKRPGGYHDLRSQVRKIGRIADTPVRVMLLTGADEGRAGNAAQFVAAGVPVIAQRHALARLPAAAAAASAAGGTSAFVAFDDEYTLRLGGVEVRMLQFGGAYSDADAAVYFPDLKAVALGALFVPDAADAPVPDFAAGGSLVNWGPVLDEILKLDFDVVVGARGGPRTRADLEAFKARIETLVAQARGLVRQGVAPDQLAARLQDVAGWNLRLTPEQLTAFHSDLARAR